MVIDRQVRSVRRHVRGAHVLWMTLVVKKDESSDPLHVRFFGPMAVVPGANGLADLVKESRFLATRIGRVCRVVKRHRRTPGG